MSLSPDDQRSVAAIRARAREMASDEAHAGTGGAEALAALADGTVSFEDIPEGAFEGCVDELGADAVVDALMAAPARGVGVAVKSASAVRTWWRRCASGIALFWNMPMVPAMAATLAIHAIGGAILLDYPSVVLYQPALVPRSIRTEIVEIIPKAHFGRATAPAPANSGRTIASPAPAPSPFAPTAPPASDTTISAIQRALESEYRITKTNYDKTDVVTPGSVVLLLKDKLLMLAASSTNACQNTYKPGQGQITQSGPCSANEKFKKMGLPKSRIPGAGSVPDSPASHTFVSGEKFWVTKIEVRDSGKDPGIVFTFFTDGISDVRYATTLLVPFEGSIPTPDKARKVVHEVITPDAREVAAGETIDQVVAALGQPSRKARIGTKEIYTYKDLKVTFVDGKVKDVQ